MGLIMSATDLSTNATDALHRALAVAYRCRAEAKKHGPMPLD